MKKIILIDNYDSFTFNLYHYLSSLKVNVDVIRNDQISSKEILKKRFELIFNIFGVKNIEDFSSKIILIKKKAELEDDLKKLGINIEKSSEKIIKGINLLRLGNNPVNIDKENIIKIISKQ